MPYQEEEITAPRISSFLGSTNDVEFLRSDLGHSRWISFEVDSIEYLDDEARYILEKSWAQAYHLYKLDANSGELSKEELHGFVLVMLASISDRYYIRSNRESGLGRYDLLLIPKKEGSKALLLEFKKVRKEE